jgi:hypothetical protein
MRKRDHFVSSVEKSNWYGCGGEKEQTGKFTPWSCSPLFSLKVPTAASIRKTRKKPTTREPVAAVDVAHINQPPGTEQNGDV